MSGVSGNKRVSASRGGQDVKISGDNTNRHDNWRELLFQIKPCTPNAAAGISCRADAAAELQKMELVVMYDTERFDRKNASRDPVIRDSVIKAFEFDPQKRYELKT